jgi:hypothetical protein
MTRPLAWSLLATALPSPLLALDVRPDPVSAVASPVGGIVLAIAAVVAGVVVIRRRRGR